MPGKHLPNQPWAKPMLLGWSGLLSVHSHALIERLSDTVKAASRCPLAKNSWLRRLPYVALRLLKVVPSPRRSGAAVSFSLAIPRTVCDNQRISRDTPLFTTGVPA